MEGALSLIFFHQINATIATTIFHIMSDNVNHSTQQHFIYCCHMYSEISVKNIVLADNFCSTKGTQLLAYNYKIRIILIAVGSKKWKKSIIRMERRTLEVNLVAFCIKA